jgi:DNA-directed RNA polymerase specialized sigma24 family protein
MGKRRNADKIVEPVHKLTAREKQRILKLYDAPYTLSQISQELSIPVGMVRRALLEMTPLDRDAPWMRTDG